MSVNIINKSSALSLNEIISNRNFIIPQYQRNYKWNTEIAKRLADDLVSKYIEMLDGKKSVKSIGLLTLYVNPSHDNTFDVIDGQQRLITLAIILTSCNDYSVKLKFERDNAQKKRENAIKCELEECDNQYRTLDGKNSIDNCTDVDRIFRNRRAIEKALSKIKDCDKKNFAEFVLDNTRMLLTVIDINPLDEFMNLNAYKTAFSVCDIIRANLISLNTFYKDELEKEENSVLLSYALDKYTYKTAVSKLYNDILSLLYSKSKSDKIYGDIYKTILSDIKNPDKTNESRINILFKNYLKTGYENYFKSDIVFENEESELIDIILKLSCIRRLLNQLKDEADLDNYSSYQQIDDYQELKDRYFIDAIMNDISDNKDLNSISLAKLLQTCTNVSNVLIKELNTDDHKLANRYLESYVHSTLQKHTNTEAEKENDLTLPMNEVIEEIQKISRFVIMRFRKENLAEINKVISIPPVIDFDDHENKDGYINLDILSNSDVIKAGELFTYDIFIPVIQRDYCMGARFEENGDDFLSFLLKGFNDGSKKLNASSIVASIDENKNIYIFDGQQRTYTMYQILTILGDKDLKDYSFIGRCENGKKNISPYSELAVQNLKKIFESRMKEFGVETKEKKDAFVDYLRNDVTFKIKLVDKISSAEQFFMDINGGVALEKYEIFKSVLCDSLMKCDELGRNIILKIENEWLDFFYDKLKITKDDDNDIEELIEMRFIELVLRKLIQINDIDIDNPVPFDLIESKGEMISRLSYIPQLLNYKVNDKYSIINQLDIVMNEICERKSEWTLSLNLEKKEYRHSSSGFFRYLCYVKFVNDELHRRELLKSIIYSLQEDIRCEILKYYNINLNEMFSVYDNDLLLDYIVKKTLNDTNEFKYELPNINVYSNNNNKSVHLLGGYRNEKKSLRCINSIEIPVYYVYEDLLAIKNNSGILRASYLLEKVSENDQNNQRDEYFFALTNALKLDDRTIKFPNKNDTYSLYLSRVEKADYDDGYKININNDEFFLMNRTDAYILANTNTQNRAGNISTVDFISKFI